MKTRIFTLIMSLFIATMAFAYDAEIDGIYYNLDETNKTAEVTNDEYDSYAGDIIIPEKVTYNGVEYTVTSIGNYAFSECSSLTSVTIGNSVTSIGNYAFSYCSSLTSVTIGNSVTSIGDEAFYDCSSLTSVTIENGVTSIGYRAFSSCYSLSSIQWNAKKCSDFRYDEDGHRPFNGCEQITSFTFGDNVEHIPAYLCYGMSKLTSITIPNSVTSIGSLAFGDCSSLTLVQWNAKKCSDFDYRSPFDGCEQITAFTFGDNVEHIPAYLCDGMSELTSITIPNSVTSIGNSAFSFCSSLTSITIPNSVTSIGDAAFEYCSSLTSVTIPNSVTEVGGALFYDCSALKSVVLSEKIIVLPADSFVNTAMGYRYEYSGFFEGCSSLTSITIPNSVTEIGERAFYYCSSLTSITIPNSVTEIGSSAFNNCTSLTSITIPNSVTEVGGGVFYGCESLQSVVLSENMTSLPMGTNNGWEDYGFFEGCELLESITIPNKVTLIGVDAFNGCRSLMSVKIPNSVTDIDGRAFYGCSSLTSIEIPNSVTYLGSEAFANCYSLRYAKLGSGFNANGEDGYLDNNLFYCEDDYVWVGDENEENGEYMLMTSSLDTLICEFGNDVDMYIYEDEHPLYGTTNLRYFQGPAKLVNTITEEYQTHFTNKLTEIHITDGELDENGFNYINRSKKSLHTIDLAGTTNTAINDLAFYDCYKLENLALPSNLETIGFKAVAECYQLKEINIPASVVEISDAAFENCRSIKSITFGGQAEAKSFASRMKRAAASGDVALQRIGNWAFYNCHALENLVIPEGVTEVGDAAFYGCTYLDSLALPSTTQRIGDNCFALCSRMKQINVNATVPPTIFAKTFFDVNRNIPVIVPEGAREAYANDEYWGEFINVVESEDVDTQIENAENANVAIYSVGGVLYVDGLSADYQVFDVNGRLVYTGRDAQLSLPRGVYMVAIEGEVEKVVL